MGKLQVRLPNADAWNSRSKRGGRFDLISQVGMMQFPNFRETLPKDSQSGENFLHTRLHSL